MGTLESGIQDLNEIETQINEEPRDDVLSSSTVQSLVPVEDIPESDLSAALKDADIEMEKLLEDALEALDKAKNEKQELELAEQQMATAQEKFDDMPPIGLCSCVKSKERKQITQDLEEAVKNLTVVASSENRALRKANDKLMMYKTAAERWKAIKDRTLDKNQDNGTN